ncbi:helicase C-terminal domain-containing protein [Rossellomorea aquimaris]|uniref:helicase C-terminal domain-containing protein n=1 Tax=Rossellomorea aquimaris TaxID=189382 RepID=UPI0005CB55E0|nr:helicase C-terminal domain-containing protein [Rossellomorea aquimaris]
MTFDFSKFLDQSEKSKEVNPIKIYDGLPKGKVNDLWRGQYLALEELSNEREHNNIAVNLNTGGGKTVIGLLYGQSLVNELEDRVFYLCGSNQLIKQTSDAAESLGLKVATYFNREMKYEREFNLGDVQCLTNYQTLFNGKNRRFRNDIKGIIFDDSHVASHIVRENFTLKISEDEFPKTYASLVGLVRPYFNSTYRLQEFDQVVTYKNDPSVLFIPLFVWSKIFGKVVETLTNEKVTEKMSTMFSWEHLRNNLDLCSVFLTSNSIEITPFLPPVQELSFMSEQTRKVFLSATVQDKPEFIRTFGFLPDIHIDPKTSAGESERLIVTPYMNPNIKEEMFEFIINLSRKEKVLIIPKSEYQARKWRDYEISFSSDDFSDKVDEFKNASHGILVAPARFEGMDFPGDTCRLLIIDGLPSGTGLMEKFLWSNLGENKFLQGTVASRVVQSMGRISRGTDDYGAVFLLGDDMADWITRKTNRNVLSPFTKAQLELGEELTKELKSIDDLAGLVSTVINSNRNKGWTNLHKTRVQQFSVTSQVESKVEVEETHQTKVARAERLFLKNLWNRNYARAARSLEETLEELYVNDKAQAAWHAHWIGYAYQLSENYSAAERYFNRSGGTYRALGRLNLEPAPTPSLPVIATGDSQPERIAKVLSERGDFNYGSFSEMDGRLAPIFSLKSSSNQYETALYWLGRYLGFESSRPDQLSNIGRGPDVFWASPEFDILLESKEDKVDTSQYSKKDVGQSHNHNIWYEEEFPKSHRFRKLMIVGPIVAANPAASPGNEMHIWTPEEIIELAKRTKAILYDSYTTSESATFVLTLRRKLEESNLSFQGIFESLPDRPIKRKES